MKLTGRGGISATIIQDSISHNDKRITTFELEYPRFIHAEFMTHRQFSRNAASSRAIPIEKMHEQIQNNMAIPIHWGINQPGMQATKELEGYGLEGAKAIWASAAADSVAWSKSLANAHLHKQIANRVTEPFQMMKAVVTATEWDNWFWLRNHADAQPEIHELASVMAELMVLSIPLRLNPGDWHVPYVEREHAHGGMMYSLGMAVISEEVAKKVSASCCAQVSYRKSDDSIEKAEMIFDKLINSEPVHASPVEHQATPIRLNSVNYVKWHPGVTHIDSLGKLWSGNFQGWIQHRQLIPNNSK